jgi:phage tail sheath protein FI
MPEYLSPGVYVEEIDTGAKPIEGVSTSTAGMVGLTERGPATGVPILVTGPGDYARWFGGLLDRNDFVERHLPPENGLLPEAVDGFFRNGGRRLYVVRVAPDEASRAERRLFGAAAGAVLGETVLLRTAREGTGQAGTPPLVVLDTLNLNTGDQVRIGDGSRAEYREATVTGGTTRHVPLNRPLAQEHGPGANIVSYVSAPFAGFGNDYTLAAGVAAGATELSVDAGADDLSTILPANLPAMVEVQSPGVREYARLTAVPTGTGSFAVALDRPLALPHAAATAVVRLLDIPNLLPAPRQLESAAAAGDPILFTTTAGGGAGQIVEIEQGVADRHEIRRQGALVQLDLRPAAYAAYPARSTVEHVDIADDGAVTARQLRALVAGGAIAISLDDRTGFAVGDVVRIGATADPGREYARIATLPGAGLASPDPGQVVLELPLRANHANGTEVRRQSEPTPAANANPTARLVLDTAAGGGSVFATDASGYTAGQLVRVTAPDGTAGFHQVAGATATQPGQVELDQPLIASHGVGSPLAEREELLRVEALDVGAWGNRLLISVEAEEPGLVSRARVTGTSPPLALALSTLTGVEAGTVIELVDPVTGVAIDQPLKVRRIDRGAANPVVLDALWGLTAAHLGAIAAATEHLPVRSREFRLTVRLRRQDDPAVPSRGEQILDSEVFRYLSMDPRHSRYVVRVLGDVAGPLRRSDRRPEGESAYVRLQDLRTTRADQEDVNLGPEALTDLMPSGIVRPARHPLTSGDDSLATLTPALFVGQDDREPDNRQGIPALKNIDDISLVACPGQTDAQVQQALINHCEEMRYRFAVLDGPPPPADAMADVLALRQRYDTKYAAVYHPWLLIPDPMPDNLAAILQVPIPPAGHVLGVYARTDVERGVHKAPANELVRGITGLRRYLNKAEHDILNPFPVNINVIRDFRPDNRAIRVWGARVVTSDPDFKYVNVRRLLIFLEKSIDRGLQWVVFEPNAEPLWARVKRTIANFLTTVWRDGALEGTKPEEAFFVICDRTTMTQADIDNGRLIVVIGVAPVKPAEFVIIRIGLKTATAED